MDVKISLGGIIDPTQDLFVSVNANIDQISTHGVSTVILAGGYINIDFTGFVPEGYTCIGYYDAKLENVMVASDDTGDGAIVAGIYNFYNKANITFYNINPPGSEANNCVATGGNGSWYSAKATLICERNDIIT